MANDGPVAVTIELPAFLNAKQRTVADGDNISGGALTVLTGDHTVQASSGGTLGSVWGGVAAVEKLALDGSTTIAVYLDGVFDMQVAGGNGAVTRGTKVTFSGANLIKDATEAQVNAGQWIGVGEETGSADEVIRVRLRGY